MKKKSPVYPLIHKTFSKMQSEIFYNKLFFKYIGLTDTRWKWLVWFNLCV